MSSDDTDSVVNLVRDIRQIVSGEAVQFGAVSGAVLGELRSLVRIAGYAVDPLRPESSDRWFTAIKGVLGCALYMAAVDLRVRTTYSLCQIARAIQSKRAYVVHEHVDQLDFMVAEELTAISRSASAMARKSSDCLELYNILMCGTYLLGARFTSNLHVRRVLDEMSKRKLTYFSYVAAKYCYLTNTSDFAAELDALNAEADALLASKAAIRESSELFHLLCDHLSAPDISPAAKRQLFARLFGGNPAKDAVEKLGQCIGFSDWGGLRVEHMLRRRQLRPVYAMA